MALKGCKPKPVMKTYLLASCLFIASLTQAQDSTDQTTSDPPHSYGKLSISYLSNSVYNGRKDSIPLPYATAAIGYYHKSGLYVTGSLNYLISSTQSRLDLVELTAGYSFSKGNWDGDFSGYKSFYNNDSKNIRSGIGGGLDGYTSYDIGFIKPSLQGGLTFGKKTDYLLGVGLEHGFEFFDEKLEITPSFLANAGSNNYYGTYYEYKTFGRRRKSGTYKTVAVDVSDASRFKWQDLEFSLPMVYDAGKFSIGFTPCYAIPVNPAQVSIQATSSTGTVYPKRIIQEKLSNTFFYTIDLSLKF